MARTALATQQVTPAGIVPAYTSANADGHSIANRGRTALHVKNGSGASINVTLVTAATVGGRAVADDVVAIGAGAEKIIGPLDEAVFNQADGTVSVDFSAVSSVTCAALILP
jgi:hypothetical protein